MMTDHKLPTSWKSPHTACWDHLHHAHLHWNLLVWEVVESNADPFSAANCRHSELLSHAGKHLQANEFHTLVLNAAAFLPDKWYEGDHARWHQASWLKPVHWVLMCYSKVNDDLSMIALNVHASGQYGKRTQRVSAREYKQFHTHMGSIAHH